MAPLGATLALEPEQIRGRGVDVTQFVERALGRLGSYTGSLCCILAQRDVDATRISRLGFGQVRTVEAPQFDEFGFDAVLIVSVGLDQRAIQRVVTALNQGAQVPSMIAVAIVPQEDELVAPHAPSSAGSWPENMSRSEAMRRGLYDPCCEAKAPASGGGLGPASPDDCVELIKRGHRVRSSLFDLGVDDTVMLMGDEVLTAHRILEITYKSEYLANRMTDIINSEVASMQKKVSYKLEQAHRKYLMMLPGHALENLPPEDGNLQEWRASNGALAGVSDCIFKAKLGSGAFAHVFKGEHRRYGACAVKVVAKRSVTCANIMVALNRELCHSLYAEPHPNIVRAFAALHGRHNFYLIMEYAGSMHLQRFMTAQARQNNCTTMPKETIRSFTAQQASAMHHLHGCFVCHRDIKPDNWIVSDNGALLRLADFGLAFQLSGPCHPLRQSCGSLPFCAPEVFSSDVNLGTGAGYDGLAADVWSLGVTYMEMALGSYSIEKMLGWVPRHPTKFEDVVAGLESIARHWAMTWHEESSGIGHVITGMIKLQPTQRWRMPQVFGPEGLDVDALSLPDPSQPGSRGARAPQQPRKGLGEGQRPAPPPGEPPPGEPPPGCGRAALRRSIGVETVAMVINRMLDHLVWTPGFGEVFSSSGSSVHELRTLYCEESEAIFDAPLGTSEDDRVRMKVAEVYASLVMTEAHFATMTDLFRTALCHYDIEEATAQEAVRRFERFKPEITATCYSLFAEAEGTNTKEWRFQLLCEPGGSDRTAEYGRQLRERLEEVSALRQSPMHAETARSLQRHLEAYLEPQGGSSGILPLPPAGLDKAAHLALIHAAKEAMLAAGFKEAVATTLYLSMLQEWDAAQS